MTWRIYWIESYLVIRFAECSFYISLCHYLKDSTVAPLVGAWIETNRYVHADLQIGRTSRRCVDWNVPFMLAWLNGWSRTSRRCVDWNHCYCTLVDGRCQVAPLVGAWIETIFMCVIKSLPPCRTSRRCVDWNHLLHHVDPVSYTHLRAHET